MLNIRQSHPRQTIQFLICFTLIVVIVRAQEIWPRNRSEHRLPTHWYYTSFTKKQIEGHLIRFILHVYACHIPVIASLEVFEPFKGLSWKRNFTADQPTALRLAKSSKYGITLEMHVHPSGKYKDNLHVSASLHKLTSNQSWEVMNQKFNIRKKCNRETCRWTRQDSLHCPRYLDDLEETLNATFILTLQNRCKNKFDLQILDRDVAKSTNNSLFTANFKNKTQVRMQLKGFNQKVPSTVKGRVKFAQFYLELFVNESSTDVHRVKLLLDMPDVGLRGKFVIMEGDFNINTKCASRGHSGEDKIKMIALVIIVLFIVGTLLFAAVWIYRRRRNPATDDFLLTSMETDDNIL